MPAYRAVLASLTAPPDTSKLVRCDEGETASAISSLTVRLMRRRRALALQPARAHKLEPVVGSLRRLQNPHLAAYQLDRCALLSEPFGALPSAVEPAAPAVARAFIAEMLGRVPPQTLINGLSGFGEAALRKARDAGVRITIVPRGRKLSHCSSEVAAIVPDIDGWAAPPAGLFVLSERHVLLRGHAMRMTVAHEFAHALDALAARRKSSYHSYESAAVRACFSSATGFVNEYAASGLDEYFAEALRAYVEVNDERSSWLPLTRYDLFVRDPRLFELVESFFAAM